MVAITFPRRPRRTLCDTANVATWTSRCGQWQVQRRRLRYGDDPPRFFVMRRNAQWGGWDIVSRHRIERAAFAAALRLARMETKAATATRGY